MAIGTGIGDILDPLANLLVHQYIECFTKILKYFINARLLGEFALRHLRTY